MNNVPASTRARRSIGARAVGAVLATLAFLVFASGCANPPSAVPPAVSVAPDVQILNPGDTIRVSFPSTPSLDQDAQQIRRDGKVNLVLIGEVKASDKTPKQLEDELVVAYGPQLTSKEVKVTVVSSALAVYVSGAVMRPGKILADRPLTAFDAIMEAGGFDTARADTKKVRIIRQEGESKSYLLNMKAMLDGAQVEVFYLKPYDTVHVPEKFQWF
jgi:polysaccharide biosynthesis/export protein